MENWRQGLEKKGGDRGEKRWRGEKWGKKVEMQKRRRRVGEREKGWGERALKGKEIEGRGGCSPDLS